MQKLSSKLALGLLYVSVFIALGSAQATEKEELALIVKQLTQVKESLLRSEIISGTENTDRYYFNYQAAQNDINHIIEGIDSYLSPNRSQPRALNLPPITGNYRDEVTNE